MLKIGRFSEAMVIMALLFPTAVLAQEKYGSPVATGDCALHVWPGNDLRSTYYGWFHGGIVDGAVQGRAGYKPLPAKPLGTDRQLEQLRKLPLQDLLGVKDYTVTIHEQPLDSRTLRSTTGRLKADTPPCYAEFAVDDAFFQEDIVNGRFLKVLFRFRRFDGGDTPTRSFGAYIQEGLKHFPAKSPEEDQQAGLDELAGAFGVTIGEFGLALNKPPKKSRKSR